MKMVFFPIVHFHINVIFAVHEAFQYLEDMLAFRVRILNINDVYTEQYSCQRLTTCVWKISNSSHVDCIEIPSDILATKFDPKSFKLY